jgi:hypothetical protein
MYVGHVAAAFLGKAARPRIPLWFLILASQAPDWVVVIGYLAGSNGPRVEHYSETVYSFLLIATPLALIYFAVSRDFRSALTVWFVCASHQIVDFFTGSKPLFPTGQAVGLGWYHRPLRDFLLEGSLVLLAAVFYRRRIPEARRNPGLLVILFSLLILTQAVLDLYLASSGRNGWFADEVNSGRLFH